MKKTSKSIRKLQRMMKYKFIDGELINTALTHSSAVNDKHSIGSNERLEFLGDAVLELIATSYLFAEWPDKPEGVLTRVRAAVVSEPPLTKLARRFDLGEHIIMGQGADQNGMRNRPSILSDTFEALLGAMYLDSGYDRTRDFVLPLLIPLINEAMEDGGGIDPKSKLQELLQRNGKVDIKYHVIKTKGPAHALIFTVELVVNGEKLSIGHGSSKKAAQRQAAQVALENL